MEDDDRSFATETLDEALLKKHHDMLQRFSARHHARKSDSHHSSSSSTFESTSSSSDDSAKIKSDLAEISSSIDDLENLTESRANVDDFLWLRVCVAGRREAFFGFHFQRW
ncbi:unnamed protein product, partial [Brassica oleracea var. botrytis]